MCCVMLRCLIQLCLVFALSWTHPTYRPNVVLVIADDLGWGDAGFTSKPNNQNNNNQNNNNNNEDIPETPNLDRAAKEGLILENLYTQAACTPTRGSLMTGKYAFRLGQLFGTSVMWPGVRKSSSYRFLSEDLSESGYKVHGIGKWHLGHEGVGMKPTERGFHSYYGIYNGMGTHYSHRQVSYPWRNGRWHEQLGNHDFHYDNSSTFRETRDDVGHHSTDLFTRAAVRRIQEHDIVDPLFLLVAYTAPHCPLQPDEEITKTRNKHITSPARRRYAAMVTQMDDGFGAIISALDKRNMRNNTVVIFLSDNGAARVESCWDYVGGSNAPYRDGKFTFFEGGIKSAAFVWSPWLKEGVKGTRSKALLHVVDVYSLILTLSRHRGGEELFHNKVSKGHDGGRFLINALQGDQIGRETLVHNLVSTSLPSNRLTPYCSPITAQPDNYAVIRHHNFKLFHGSLHKWCHSDVVSERCPEMVDVKGRGAMLFDLDHDPYERVNVAGRFKEVVLRLIEIIEEYSKDAPSEWVV